MCFSRADYRAPAVWQVQEDWCRYLEIPHAKGGDQWDFFGRTSSLWYTAQMSDIGNSGTCTWRYEAERVSTDFPNAPSKILQRFCLR